MLSEEVYLNELLVFLPARDSLLRAPGPSTTLTVQPRMRRTNYRKNNYLGHYSTSATLTVQPRMRRTNYRKTII